MKRVFISFGLGCWICLGFGQTDCKVLKPEISLVYKGECKNGLAHGEGEASGRDRYVGKFKNGLPNGKGTYEWTSGEVYEGNWKKGMRHGQGEYSFFADGKDSVLLGKWVKDEYIGQSSTRSYTVEYKNNIGRVTFNKIGESPPYVRLKFLRGGNELSVSDLFLFGSSGTETAEMHFVGFEMVEFPFEGKATFSAPGTWHSGSYMNCEIRYTINEPGTWVVNITLN